MKLSLIQMETRKPFQQYAQPSNPSQKPLLNTHQKPLHDDRHESRHVRTNCRLSSSIPHFSNGLRSMALHDFLHSIDISPAIRRTNLLRWSIPTHMQRVRLRVVLRLSILTPTGTRRIVRPQQFEQNILHRLDVRTGYRLCWPFGVRVAAVPAQPTSGRRNVAGGASFRADFRARWPIAADSCPIQLVCDCVHDMVQFDAGVFVCA